jgi:FkbM family methyltransferase
VRKLARLFARLIFGHAGLARRLETSAWVQGLARRLRVREWINAALARHPLRRRLAGSGVRYSIETFEALAVEKTYFGQPIYAEIFAAPPATFIDLGCNSGLFPCLLAHLAGGRAPRGMGVDANVTQVRLAEKAVALNGWKDVHLRCGLVGNEVPGDEAEFHLHPTSLGSSQFPYRDSESGRAPDWKRIVVPSLRVAETWTGLFGASLRCEILKIDIEGSEMNFLRQEAAFLPRVDTILLEWHLWTTTPGEVTTFLAAHGFDLKRTLEETPRHGVLFFRRRAAREKRGE